MANKGIEPTAGACGSCLAFMRHRVRIAGFRPEAGVWKIEHGSLDPVNGFRVRERPKENVQTKVCVPFDHSGFEGDIAPVPD